MHIVKWVFATALATVSMTTNASAATVFVRATMSAGFSTTNGLNFKVSNPFVGLDNSISSGPIEYRTVIEFFISGVPLRGTVTSAFLSFAPSGSEDGNLLGTIVGSGYIGDGVARSGNLINSIDIFTATGNNTAAIDVTDFIKSLKASQAIFAGFALRQAPRGVCASVAATAQGGCFAYIDGPGNAEPPYLTINYDVAAVPEPATWAMMLVGFGMVAGAARYRRRSVKVLIA